MYTLRSSGVLAKYSLSISPSIRFLITTGLGRKRARSCWVTWTNTQKKKRRTESNSIKIVVHYLKNENGFCKMDEFLTSATRTLCCIFFLDFMIRTMAASISCFLSSSTFCRVSFLSGSDSPCLAATGKIGYRNCITERKCPNSTSKNAMVTQPPCNSKYFRTEAFTYA